MRRMTYAAVAVLVLGSLAASGCGDDDDVVVTPTATATPSATPTPTVTVTPTPAEPPHTENVYGSTTEGGGALAIDAASHVDVTFAACIGGSGDDCDGGTVVYMATDPGFESAEEDEPEEPLFVLEDGTPVSVEITAIQAGVSLKFDEVTLSAVGQSVLLGTTPVHRDVEWLLALPGGHVEERQVSFKLTTTSRQYAESEVVTVTLEPTTAGEHEHDE